MQVDFDTDGTTSVCPKHGFVTSDECEKCEHYRGSFAFRVDCVFEATIVEELALAMARNRRATWND